jgi:hypothetical protein
VGFSLMDRHASCMP